MENKNLKQLVTDDIFIGKGGFGDVFGPCFWNDKTCAVKRRMCGAIENCKKEQKACKYWMSLHHKNLIRVNDVSFESSALYILMEYGSGGSLKTVLGMCTSALPVEILMDWSIQIAQGMAYLHRNKIVHRDLKSANVIIMEPDAAIDPYGKTLKIIDFDQIREYDHTTVMSSTGTHAWMAPEIFDSGHFSKASDVWSYGVVLWEMLTREVPYKDIAYQAIAFRVLNRTCQLTVPNLCPDSIRTVLERSQRYERGYRPTFDSILSTLKHSQETGSSIQELPLELLDIILLRSYRYYVSSGKQSVGKKDEFIIQQLASVDFCWFQRLTRRRFKHRIWRHTSEFYREFYRKVAILRNNKYYITENIQHEGLIKQLRSADCVSDLKARLICRIHVKKSLLDKSELLHAVRLFDDTQFSTFVHYLRQSNQKCLTRIEENGGVVVKTSVRTSYKEGRPLLQEGLVQKLNDLRDKGVPRSHETDKLIMELKDGDIEILNAVLDRQVVVWIWCKSQKGLTELQNLDESKPGLINVFTGLTHSSSFPETIKPAVVSVCRDQFKKEVAVRKLAIKLTASLGVDTFVRGVTKLRNEIYVLCRSNEYDPTVIWVFEDNDPFDVQKNFQLNECELSCDIVSSEKENCLYVSDLRTASIWKIELTQGTRDQYKAIRWLSSYCDPYTMSTSSDGQLLIIERGDISYLYIYGSDAELLFRSQLPAVIKCPRHAVETSIGNFIIIDESKEEQNESSPPRSDRKTKWIIYQVTRDGQLVIGSSVLSSGIQEGKNPWYISLYSDDQVFVAASSKVSLLHSDLTANLTVDNKIQTTGPNKLFYDDEKKQLIVSGISKGVNVYNLNLK